MTMATLRVRIGPGALHVSFHEDGARATSGIDHRIIPDDANPAETLADILKSAPIGNIDLFFSGSEGLAAGAGYPVGLVAIGLPDRAVKKLAAAAIITVPGAIDVTGEEITPLAEGALLRDVSALVAGHAVEAIAVSGINSLMSPLHEARAADLLRTATRLPVIEARYMRPEANAVQRLARAGQTAQCLLRIWQVIDWLHIGRDTDVAQPPPGEPAHGRAAGAHDETAVPDRETPTLRLLDADEALVAAITCCPLGAPAALALPRAVIESRARIARAAPRCYACHCDDARYEFDSMTAARQFAEIHLRQLVAERARGAGLRQPVIEVQADDRFTQIRGRKGPVRVYLETHLVARASDLPPAGMAGRSSRD